MSLSDYLKTIPFPGDFQMAHIQVACKEFCTDDSNPVIERIGAGALACHIGLHQLKMVDILDKPIWTRLAMRVLWKYSAGVYDTWGIMFTNNAREALAERLNVIPEYEETGEDYSDDDDDFDDHVEERKPINSKKTMEQWINEWDNKN